MSRADVLSTMPVIRSDRGVPRSLAVLIEVPEVKSIRSRRARTSVIGHAESRSPRGGRSKRRLRREVRIAGCALLAMAPLISACTVGWSARPARVLACSIRLAAPADPSFERGAPLRRARLPQAPTIDSAEEVLLAIEPAALAPGADNDVPVVFPGYVLPDDSLEGSTHEGS
jgi:hypothetical protein